MAKFKTERLMLSGPDRNDYSIIFDIYINKDGSFVTTLPANIIKLFEDANIQTSRNKLGNKGYFSSNTYDGVVNQVKDICLEYLSREMTSEKIVIRYCIQTRVSYAFDKNGEVIPNPSSEWSGVKDEWNNGTENRYAKWIEGNVNISAVNNSPFGLLVYAKPTVKRDYVYRSGKAKSEFERLSSGGDIATTALRSGRFLKWLNDVPCISPPPDGIIKEVEYSESVCEFFVGLIKSIAIMNERIKDFLEPESIKLIAESKTKLLG